jgi:hypothetical protein
MYGSPPAFLHIATGDACSYLRAAFRVWAVELRPLWRPKGLGTVGCCADHQAGSDPPVDECLLLAELDVPIGPDLQVAALTSPLTDIIVNQERRPYLLHLRFLQEWLTCASRAKASQSISLFGDVTGNPAANTLRAIQNVPVVPPAGGLQNNFVLTFKNNSWQGAALPAGPPPPPVVLGGDVQGAAASNEIKKLQGKDVNAPNPQPKQVLVFDNGVWQPVTLPAPVTPDLGGDLSGPVPNARINKIQTVPISLPAPQTTGNVLTLQGGTLVLAPPAAAPTNVVEHPPNLPRYLIVAAGFVNGSGGPAMAGAPVYNGLKASAQANGILELVFAGYTVPTNAFQYVVKAMAVPVRNADSVVQNALTVNFLAFVQTGIQLFVALPNGTAAPGDTIKVGQFMIEISQFL